MNLFDLHCDTASEILKQNKNLKSNSLHIDLDRIKGFKSYCQVFAFFVPDGLEPEKSLSTFINTYDYFEKQLAKNKPDIYLCKNRGDMEYTINQGRTAAIYSIENGAALGGDLNTLYFCAGIGVKLITLTWNGENQLGFGCKCGGGLKPFGIEAVRIMNELGIVADVSHISDEGFWQVIDLARSPVAATHSNSRFVLPHERNLTDEQFCAIRETGGIVGINLYPLFLSGREEADFEDIFRHVYHFLELGGENTLAIGADFDGAGMDKKWNGVQFIPDVYGYLSSRGITDDILDKIFFKNAYDFFLCMC